MKGSRIASGEDATPPLRSVSYAISDPRHSRQDLRRLRRADCVLRLPRRLRLDTTRDGERPARSYEQPVRADRPHPRYGGTGAGPAPARVALQLRRRREVVHAGWRVRSQDHRQPQDRDRRDALRRAAQTVYELSLIHI